MTEPIIQSLLATDLYKFTMWQALLHAYPANTARYEFRCRNTPRKPLARLIPALEREIDAGIRRASGLRGVFRHRNS